jgi:hypothetical protein
MELLPLLLVPQLMLQQPRPMLVLGLDVSAWGQLGRNLLSQHLQQEGNIINLWHMKSTTPEAPATRTQNPLSKTWCQKRIISSELGRGHTHLLDKHHSSDRNGHGP